MDAKEVGQMTPSGEMAESSKKDIKKC